MIKDKKDYKDSMYDYANINEYYSYYGNLVFISSDYFYGDDYFIVLKQSNKYALVTVSKADLGYFSALTNRDKGVEDLDRLAANITFVEGYTNFTQKIEWHLVNTFFNSLSRKELIRIKNNPLILWNLMQIENTIGLFKKDKVLPMPPLMHDTRQINQDIYTSTVTAQNLYNTQFTMSFEWVSGNPFMDITIYHFNHKMHRRLYLHDILELAPVFSVMVTNDEYKTVAAIEEFKIA
jgi:hypothetical protein